MSVHADPRNSSREFPDVQESFHYLIPSSRRSDAKAYSMGLPAEC